MFSLNILRPVTRIVYDTIRRRGRPRLRPPDEGVTGSDSVRGAYWVPARGVRGRGCYREAGY